MPFDKKLLEEKLRAAFAESSIPSTQAEAGIKAALSAISVAASQVLRRDSSRKLPPLPAGLEWPIEKFENAPERRKPNGIVLFLERVWQPLIEVCPAIAARWILFEVDLSAYGGVANYTKPHPKTRERRKLPSHVNFLTLEEINDQELASVEGRDLMRLASVRSRRRKRAILKPEDSN